MKKPEHDTFYTARAVEGFIDQHNGRPISRAKLEICDDEHPECSGWKVPWNGWMHTPGCEGVTLKSLGLMGWVPGSDPFEFDGRTVRVRVVHNDNGYAEADGIWEHKARGSGKQRESSMDGAQRAVLAAQMAAKMTAMGVGTVPPEAPRSQGWVPPKNDAQTERLGFCADCGSAKRKIETGQIVCSNEGCEQAIPF